MELDNQYYLWIAIASYVLYVGVVYLRYGVQKSVSDSYYCWKKEWGLLFTLFTWGLGIGIIGMIQTVASVASVSGLWLVGTIPYLTSKPVRRWHMIGAYTCVLGSQVVLWLDYGMWWMVAVNLLSFVGIKVSGNKNWIWYVENIAIVSVLIALIIGQ